MTEQAPVGESRGGEGSGVAATSDHIARFIRDALDDPERPAEVVNVMVIGEGLARVSLLRRGVAQVESYHVYAEGAEVI